MSSFLRYLHEALSVYRCHGLRIARDRSLAFAPHAQSRVKGVSHGVAEEIGGQD